METKVQWKKSILKREECIQVHTSTDEKSNSGVQVLSFEEKEWSLTLVDLNQAHCSVVPTQYVACHHKVERFGDSRSGRNSDCFASTV